MGRMLGAELTAHLGYDDGKDAPPDQVNCRNGTSAKRVKGQGGEARPTGACATASYG